MYSDDNLSSTIKSPKHNKKYVRFNDNIELINVYLANIYRDDKFD